MVPYLTSLLIALLSSSSQHSLVTETARWSTKQPPSADLHQKNRQQVPHLAFMGGGIFFYWQAGVITYLREQGYDLSKTTSTGASAGALAATLTACDVDFYKATDAALGMAKEAGVWKRSKGLQGIWGPMIRDWLDMLLPEDAATRMTQRGTSLLVTAVPQFFEKRRVSTFEDRNDLIDCNMASVHLPWFLDGQWTTTFRKQKCIDGSFLANRGHYIPDDNGRRTLFLSHQRDERYSEQNLLSFVKAVNPDGIYELIEDGKKYASMMEEQGKLQNICKVDATEMASSRTV